MTELIAENFSNESDFIVLFYNHCQTYEFFISRLKFTSCIGCEQKEIITENSLEAVREIVTYLRNIRVIRNAWLFREEGIAHQGIVSEIVAAIVNGSSRTVRSILEAGWRLEASQALYNFLSRLKQPLIPISIQSLVLDNNNDNVTPEVVAADVLGLIREDLSERHIKLIGLILHLLDCSMKLSPADELRGHMLPISMLPIFFNIENYHFMHEWRRILSIFVELIRQAPNVLETGDLDIVF
ncbi:uncharacterized protein [Euwallacea similis]|uniref:uncharacterized protein n=1 Tax=Euwallacea similis TaxID=1736056 RepID=UPI0034509B67